jgi:putative CRISPR-associated protein (TIGR02620 family)
MHVDLIVSRHAGAIEWIRANVPGVTSDTPVQEAVTPGDVRGRVVCGNLPLHLAAAAKQVLAVEFSGPPPRGQEYGAAEMTAAGARVAAYSVVLVPPPQAELRFNDGRKSRGHRDLLFVGVGPAVHRFAGQHIPGVVAVARSDYEKNGKWSNSTYYLRLAPGAWHLVSGNDWETGDRFHGCESVAAVVAEFRAAGCTAADADILAMLERECPKTVARIRAIESALASVMA